MAEEERPRKLQKLDVPDNDPTPGELGPAMTGALLADESKQNTAATGQNPEEAATSTTEGEAKEDNAPAENVDATAGMSKNQLRRLRKKEKWEKDREHRKSQRKEKAAAKKERRHKMLEEARATGGEEAVTALRKSWASTRALKHKSTLIPLSIVIDCGYDDLMNVKERISLASQLTRVYSENTRAPWRSHLMFSSFDKLLKERFDTVLVAHKNWKGIQIIQEDFARAAELAKEHMASPKGGALVGPFADQTEAKPEDGEVIYLSSDSPNTLTELKPYSTYIIGGLVDKNRYKAVCYKEALKKGMKTAKLPIGQYIQMASRTVLTTNHVVDIMLNWLELKDWGEAFMKVIPPRKGGKLRTQSNEADDNAEEVEDYAEDDVEDVAEEDHIAAVEAAADDGEEE
ncbi:hypothetical protein N7468_009528 [Penicillium chermesinum]|uniref:tRNA (guanine(9)-N1)-methyltransferase n=1 Tax=Penicillium chermesinum TaxID=63820 RepID=A0A9W9TFC1_9EURO|nr:uncharacterized protein N7468_009528 [Penicillium chermesinum]KAJ5220324.1 hypothetical protein N7468_009528 [Penicillium chermesinum]KAJ6157767.1 hypothetical protein N7470_005359 [Penicillium chermesinum]